MPAPAPTPAPYVAGPNMTATPSLGVPIISPTGETLAIVPVGKPYHPADWNEAHERANAICAALTYYTQGPRR